MISPVMKELRKLGDRDLLGRLIWAEAQGEPVDGKFAVGCVVMNRVKDEKRKYGKTITDIILTPWQFSCFNESNTNMDKILSPPSSTTFKECMAIATMLMSGNYIDCTDGATHYFNNTKNGSERISRMHFKKTIGTRSFYYLP